jgi:hypothetical protein
MLEWHRVDDFNGSIWSRAMSKEQTVDCLVRIFESMADNFGVGQVVEVIVHTPIAWWVRIGSGRVPGRRNRDAVGLMCALALCHFLFLAFLGVASIAFLTVCFLVHQLVLTRYLCVFILDDDSLCILRNYDEPSLLGRTGKVD